MTRDDGCLSEQVLADWAAGTLSPAAHEMVRNHLVRCPRCLQIGQSLMAKGGAVDSAGPVTLTEGPRPPPPESNLDPPQDADARFDRSLLEPTDNREALGRLGKYDVLAELGNGGMGVVLRGLDIQLYRPVAIKLLSPALAASEVARRRFLREARSAAAVNHHHVVTIYAVEEFRGTPAIVMELVPGCTLRSRIRSQPALTPVDMVRISAQVASGLAAAHAQGVIHRDVKPANIMLEENTERAKLLDFGIARAAIDNVDLTSQGLAPGTPAYMAPEQVRGEELDPRADLFSLGCVMHAMSTGHSPFQGRNAWETGQQVLEFEPPPLHQVEPAIPQFFSDIVVRLLRKNREERYASAAEVAEILLGHLATLNQTPSHMLEAVMHRPRPSAPPPPRKRSATAWWIAAAVVLVLAVGLPVASWLASSGGTRGVGAPGAGPAVPPPTAVVISVAQQGPADVRSLAEALQRVQPGAEIRVLDSAVYRESLASDDPARYAGVRLVSAAGATLASPPESPFAVLMIKNTPNVAVRGLKIRSQAFNHGVAILGDCPGARVEACDLAGETDEHWALIYITEKAAGEPDNPIVISDSTIRDRALGLLIQGEGSGWAAAHIQVRGNRFDGPGEHVLLNRAVQHLTLNGNVFVHGIAIGCRLTATPPSTAVVVGNNTFFENDCWLDFGDAPPRGSQADVRRNLIVRCPCIRYAASPLSDYSACWSFSQNLWEPTADSHAEDVAAVAKPVGTIRFLSQAANDPDYLRPSSDSPAAVAIAEGDAPPYVGAVAPAPAPAN